MKTTVSQKMTAKKAVLSAIFSSAWALKKRYDGILANCGAVKPKQFMITFSEALKEMWANHNTSVAYEIEKKERDAKKATEAKLQAEALEVEKSLYYVVGGVEKMLNITDATVEIGIYIYPFDTRRPKVYSTLIYQKSALKMKDGKVWAKGLKTELDKISATCTRVVLA